MAHCPYCGADIARVACKCAGMMPCTYPGCAGTADGTSCRHPRAEDGADGCAGCEWEAYTDTHPGAGHVHDAGEDGGMIDCCAHTCGRPTLVPRVIAGRRVWRPVWRVRHCGACAGMVWRGIDGMMYTTPEDAAFPGNGR